ncbi:MAG: Inositol 2-dehydrogenase [candidate division TA06 bacterium ADurb.Bin131]|uniref:Inositol 2-dehydrogenase n=1 Tax=candidate division TA06 bacterium ADurb.Bin131 TaxID=1852827 RepID=A0A1V6C9Z0_UNCT6|nr:MAG: Inositol 2-dehydrogenase [candidate division TA06 bacterium ADurb.Bin131]HRV03447.1 Gfo/Idh/MocA family oxidoreductase [Candidatus Ratteibacteria bacterium]
MAETPYKEKEYGVGIAGYGFIGKVHAYAYKTIPFYYDDLPAKIKLIGVSAHSEESRKKAIKQAGFEFATSDYMELVKNKSICIINCCLPNNLHYELVKAAILEGKHVYCDKPLAINTEQAENLTNLAENSNVKTQIVFQLRFFPAVIRAKQIIDNGFLGKINFFRFLYLHSSCVKQSSKPYSWKAEFEKVGGGVLVDLGSHIIDLARYLVGEFKSVYAEVRNFTSPDKRTDDLALINAEIVSGATGILEASKIATGTNDEVRFEIYGSEGAVAFNSMEPNWLWAYSMKDPDNPVGGFRGYKKIETVQKYPDATGIPLQKFSIGWIRTHVACLHSFLHSVMYNETPQPSFKDGLAVQKIIEAAYNSARDQTRVEL